MRLSRIEIRNFRRIEYADVRLSPASFIIGPNNTGKTSVLRAVEALLTLADTVVKPEDFRILDDGSRADTVEIIGYFTDIDEVTANSQGFKGRVINGEFYYKKKYAIKATKPEFSTRQYEFRLNEAYKNATTWSHLVELGHPVEDLERVFDAKRPAADKLPKDWHFCIEGAVEWDVTSTPTEVPNPGGFASIVCSRLPRLVHVPSYAKVDDIGRADGKSVLSECLGILFEDLLGGHAVTAEIQNRLSELERLMSPGTEGSMVDTLCSEVNSIIGDVFPDCGIKVLPSLQNVSEVVKPKYQVELFSNVNTDAERQGTGLIRTGIFSMLKYHSRIRQEHETNARSLIVAFEEPEIYLHPSAANLLRDTIYSLGASDQIICTTHSPWMIDLTQDWQSLTKLTINEGNCTNAINYGLSEATQGLLEDEKALLKMVKLFDDELSRVFFAEKCVIVEGDSEVVAIKSTLTLLAPEVRKQVMSHVQVVRARGKAAIIPLAKYLRALSIPFYVIHDRDADKQGAAKFNEPILAAVGDASKVSALEECLEHCLGYEPPEMDKPFKVYEKTREWKSTADIPERWKHVFEVAFGCTLG